MNLYDCMFGKTKPQPIMSGCLPIYWTPGNASPGDGTYRWEDKAYAYKYAKEALMPSGDHTFTSRLSVCDFEVPQRTDVDATVRTWIKNVKAFSPGQLLTTYGYYIGHNVPEDLLIQDWNACFSSNRTPEQNKRRLAIRSRCRAQKDIVTQMGTIAFPASLTEPESFERDLEYMSSHVRLYKELFPGVPLIGWCAGIWGFGPLAMTKIHQPYLTRYAEKLKTFDNVILWGDWSISDHLYKELVKV